MITNQNDKELTDSLLFDDPNVPDQDALDIRFKRYLLGNPDFTEEDVGEIEELMIDDERYFERMMLVEGELTENFVRGRLTADEADRFEWYFLTTPERKKKLELVKLSVSGSAKSPEVEETETEPSKSAPSWWKSNFAFLDSSNLLAGFAAVAVVLLFLSIGAIWWLSQSGDTSIAVAPSNQSAQNSNLNNANQIEITRAENKEDLPTPQPSVAESPAPQKTPNSVQTTKEIEKPTPTPTNKPTEKKSPSVVFALFPGGLRGVEDNGSRKIIAPNTKTVKLELKLVGASNYEDFLVVIEDSDGREIARRGNLKKSKNGKLLIVEFPAESFESDTYKVSLSGRKNGEYTNLSFYSFQVLK